MLVKVYFFYSFIRFHLLALITLCFIFISTGCNLPVGMVLSLYLCFCWVIFITDGDKKVSPLILDQIYTFFTHRLYMKVKLYNMRAVISTNKIKSEMDFHCQSVCCCSVCVMWWCSKWSTGLVWLVGSYFMMTSWCVVIIFY